MRKLTKKEKAVVGITGVAGLATLFLLRSKLPASVRQVVQNVSDKITSGASFVFDAAKTQAFKTAIAGATFGRASAYADLILQVAREESVSPFLIVAFGERESRWGEALSPKGPRGTGDVGHGHGLLQIDDRSFASWLNSNDWGDPLTNIRKGVQVLKGKMNFFRGADAVPGLTDGRDVTLSSTAASKRGVQPGLYSDPRPLSDPGVLLEAAVAAYNTGEGSVLQSLAARVKVDTTTAGKNYSADVLAKAAQYEALFQSKIT